MWRTFDLRVRERLYYSCMNRTDPHPALWLEIVGLYPRIIGSILYLTGSIWLQSKAGPDTRSGNLVGFYACCEKEMVPRHKNNDSIGFPPIFRNAGDKSRSIRLWLSVLCWRCIIITTMIIVMHDAMPQGHPGQGIYIKVLHNNLEQELTGRKIRSSLETRMGIHPRSRRKGSPFQQRIEGYVNSLNPATGSLQTFFFIF
jgi:hypothetical protein